MQRALLALAALILGPGTAAGDMITVPGDYPTIQAAVDAASDGDEIVVADGVYTGPGNRDVQTGTRSITIRSAGGPEACVIDCEAAARGFIISGEVRLEGLTIRDGASDLGGALHIEGDATIVNCILRENAADTGGAAFVFNVDATFIGCTFTDNAAEVFDAGAIYNAWGSSTFVNCLFTGNSAQLLGGAIFSDLAWLDMINCTLSGNVAGNGGGIASYAGVTTTLFNCILWGNENGQGGGFQGQISSNPSNQELINYTCIEGLPGQVQGAGNIDEDPLFADPDNDDFRLQPGSPCIDAGHNWAVAAPNYLAPRAPDPALLSEPDLDGNPRFADGAGVTDPGCGTPVIVDMGTYEHQGSPFEVKLGDLDGSGTVGTTDLLDLLAAWGEVGENCQLADLNLDGVVDTSDLLIQIVNWE